MSNPQVQNNKLFAIQRKEPGKEFYTRTFMFEWKQFNGSKKNLVLTIPDYIAQPHHYPPKKYTKNEEDLMYLCNYLLDEGWDLVEYFPDEWDQIVTRMTERNQIPTGFSVELTLGLASKLKALLLNM